MKQASTFLQLALDDDIDTVFSFIVVIKVGEVQAMHLIIDGDGAQKRWTINFFTFFCEGGRVRDWALVIQRMCAC